MRSSTLHPRLPWSEPQLGPSSLGTRKAGTQEPKFGTPGLWPGRPWASSSAPLEPRGPSLSGRGCLALGPDSIPCSAFEEEQQHRKQEIVSRLLKEEAVEDRRRPRPEPPRPTGQRSLRDQTWSYVATFCDGQSTEAPPCCPLVSGWMPRQHRTVPASHDQHHGERPGPRTFRPGIWMASRLLPKAGRVAASPGDSAGTGRQPLVSGASPTWEADPTAMRTLNRIVSHRLTCAPCR